ncbi:hypothetical protein [Pseudomonas coleopterorum]|uniref:hypothetical protein n=1 Tax=Pseudomonas coleopterorum TaxID=1605838 RepID=UPI00177F6661|nr:hypothetical protein [Pseudomonas coleopterorum]MBD8483478.1 hypothetical protein [Pseudomonas coleopterorum]
MDEEVVEFLRAQQAEYEERTFFLTHSLGAENHWLFAQAYEAMTQGLYLPACTGFITGIEASIRNTMAQIKKPNRVEHVDDVSTLSNGLLRAARAQGLPVDCLIFPGEEHFEANLQTKTHVEIVRIRHNLCHGNILEYVNTELGEGNAFFTPECCRDLAHMLYAISRNWAAGLGQFRKQLFSPA